MQCDQLLQRTWLANQDKVHTGRQTCQVTVTVTHNREEGRQDGWQQEGEGIGKMVVRRTRGKEARGEWAGPPPRIEGRNDGGQRDQRERGRVNGGGLGSWEPGAP